MFLGFLFIWGKIISSEPLYDMDMVAYMGVITEMEEDNPQKIHRTVFDEMKKELSDSMYLELTTGVRYRTAYHDDAELYYGHLSFYRVKPLYTRMAHLLNKSGLTLIQSLLWVSILSFWGIGMLFYYWVGKHLSPLIAFGISILVMMLAPVADLARDITPDALSIFLVLSSMYAFCYLHRGWLFVIIMLAILARVDNFILASVIGFVLFFKKSEINNERGWGIGLILMGGVLFLTIPHLVGNTTEWIGKFSHTFSIKQYISEWIFSINAFRYSHFHLLLVLGIILFPLLRFLDALHLRILAIIFLTMSIRLVLFPSFQDRFFVGFELVLIIVLARLMDSNLSKINYSNS